MDQEFSLEAIPLEIDPETDLESEWGRRNLAKGRPGSGFWPRRPKFHRPLPIPPTGKPRPGKPGPRRPWAAFPAPYPYPVGPRYPAPPSGSEHIRWVQDCLNQVLGLQLAVTGLMGPDTRSAVRSFQRERGLRVNGIVGPDTVDALREACRSQSPERDTSGEIQDAAEIGPLNVTLKWLINPKPHNSKNLYLFDRLPASRQSGGGIYIAVDSSGGIQKVGKTGSFRSRFGKDTTYRSRPWEFYLARISAGDILGMTETAVARLLLRAGRSLPGSRHVADVTVQDRVEVKNILPPPLLALQPTLVSAAYRGTPAKTGGVYPRATTRLILDPAIYPKWELPPW